MPTSSMSVILFECIAANVGFDFVPAETCGPFCLDQGDVDPDFGCEGFGKTFRSVDCGGFRHGVSLV